LKLINLLKDRKLEEIWIRNRFTFDSNNGWMEQVNVSTNSSAIARTKAQFFSPREATT
jgi:hypothetical protein